MRSNYLKVFALFVIVLCVCPLRTIAQIKTFLHEEKDYGLESPPRVAKIKSYDDLVVVRIVRNDTNDIKVEGWGMIIDFDGKVFDRTPIGVWGYKDFRRLYKLRVPLIQISLNIKKENGFIIGYKLLESNDFEWKQYKMELDGKLTILTNGKIKLDSRTILERNSLISTVDEGYSFIYKVNDTLPNSALKDLIIAELIGYNKTDVDKVYLYRVNLLDRIPQPISCNIQYVGVGHSCSLPMIYNKSNYNLKIGFLSSGAIISLNITHIEFPNNEFRFRSWRLQNLIFGGYMLPEIIRANNRLYIYVFAENDGTNIIKNSSNVEQNQFFNALLDDTVQISRGCLSKNSKNQIDPKSNDGRFLININIYESKNTYEKDVNSVIQDINYMMSYHDQSNGKLTYLDFTYGFIPAPNYLQEYGPKLLGLLLIIILLIIFYFLANKRERKGHNIVIFKFSLYIFDFVFDTLFIINNVNDVKRLYIPSLIFYTVPIGLNMASTFLIMAKENTRNEFYRGFGYFQAPFSDSAKTIIAWIAFINIFIEDIPQFIIQI
ncbi:hypothetical protein C1646_785629 [Rhizophagus diaphanus]|nr:hypothetical protein C1646_785629 [Rhizophagus diaphanus] [Rhizophagus sp. MUCL 43196]